MKIHWHKRAAAQLHQVEEYILRDFGERIRQDFMDEVEQTTLLLADMPSMGSVDPLLAHRQQTYRSIIVRKLNKIVYYVKGDTLHIAAFWDTRREPKRQARRAR
ncbi:MAG: type II toxin-antitoxin system RelE/ParE family toxin [Prevotella sp.]|nr:type II toxin-antitoxin system RelE/ParE family toxin [Prevotella sp.]